MKNIFYILLFTSLIFSEDCFQSFAAGFYHSLGLKLDGTVEAWGGTQNIDQWDPYGETDVPLDLVDVISIAAGQYHSIALKSNLSPSGVFTYPYGQATPL